MLERLPDCDVAQFYGMTEAAPTVTHLSGEDHRRGGERLASVGVPVPGVEVDVRDGELWVRGPNVMLGYWNRPDETAEALRRRLVPHRRHRATPTRTATSTCVDRAKDMIITGGENVYSLEVEAALCGHPAVAEAAVFGVPDDRWGEAVHAVVVPRGRAHRRRRCSTTAARLIAGFKVPREIDLRDEPLPEVAARQDPQARAARAVLGRPRAPRELARARGRGSRSCAPRRRPGGGGRRRRGPTPWSSQSCAVGPPARA